MHEYQQHLNCPDDYYTLIEQLDKLPRKEKNRLMRHLGRTDLFFLLWVILGRKDIFHPWLFARCREVQETPDGHLDLWARGHYKSTIITFGKTIQDILASHGQNPLPRWNGKAPSFGIFSHTRPIAKGFLSQLKREFELNPILRELYDDIFWQNPHRDAPKWSEDDGIILQRDSNPKESTIEAWGLIDGQPTSKHFDVMIYDDVITHESVRSPLMIQKSLESFQMSQNLGATTKTIRMIGTRYHANDLYKFVIDQEICLKRIHKATENGEADGVPVFLTPEKLAEKRKDLGTYTFSTQMLQAPISDDKACFLREWLRHYSECNRDAMNVYILVDAANEKKKTSDYTAMVVIGLAADNNYYVLDIIRDRLSLTERKKALFNLHRRYKPIAVGYEKYGIMADVAHMKDCMDRESYHFEIVELGGAMPKRDRISRLQPLFESNRFYFPIEIKKNNWEGKQQNLMEVFLREEYDDFPLAVHDDMFDAMARIVDENLGAVFPNPAADVGAIDMMKKYWFSNANYSGSARA